MSQPFQRYADRTAAGEVLAQWLVGYRGRPEVVVLGLPRGGIVVAAPVARGLGAALEALVVRKLGVPGHAELAIGAVAAIGDDIVAVRNEYVLRRVGISDDEFAQIRGRETRELQRRRRAWGSVRTPVDVTDKTAILVDDGLATGSTMRAAVAAVRRRGPREVVVAVPIAAPEVASSFAVDVDRLVCPWTPEGFHSVGEAYADFSQVADDEVARLLSR